MKSVFVGECVPPRAQLWATIEGESVCVCRGQLRGNPMERGGKTELWKKHSHSYKAQVNSPALLTSPCITSQLVNRVNFLWPGPHVLHRGPNRCAETRFFL